MSAKKAKRLKDRLEAKKEKKRQKKKQKKAEKLADKHGQKKKKSLSDILDIISLVRGDELWYYGFHDKKLLWMIYE